THGASGARPLQPSHPMLARSRQRLPSGSRRNSRPTRPAPSPYVPLGGPDTPRSSYSGSSSRPPSAPFDPLREAHGETVALLDTTHESSSHHHPVWMIPGTCEMAIEAPLRRVALQSLECR